jgi:hypothetical protein
MRRLFLLLPILALALGGCVTRVEVPSSSSILGPARERIPIRAFALQSDQKEFEIKQDMRIFGGDSRGILFPKQARVFLTDDMRGYVDSRFAVDPAAADAPALTINLEQAYSYFTMHQSGLNWVPFVGIGVAVAEGFQKVPIVFVVEAKASITAGGQTSKEIDVFIRQTETVTGWSATASKNKEIYQREIEKLRTELFARLDAQLLTQWENRRFVGVAPQSRSSVADLASELAELDTALADAKITQSEYDRLVGEAKGRASVGGP